MIESDDRLKNLPRTVKDCWSGGWSALPPSPHTFIEFMEKVDGVEFIQHENSRRVRLTASALRTWGRRPPDSFHHSSLRMKRPIRRHLWGREPSDRQAEITSGADSALLPLVYSVLTAVLSHDSLLKTASGITCEVSFTDGDFVFVLSRRRDVLI